MQMRQAAAGVKSSKIVKWNPPRFKPTKEELEAERELQSRAEKSLAEFEKRMLGNGD